MSKINREDSRLIKSLVTNTSDLEYLDCVTTRGLMREINEDFVATAISETNTDIKLLVLCDGMGGYERGEEASKFVVTRLLDWFNNFDFSNGLPEDIAKIVTKEIKRINRGLKKQYNESATTLTMALVGEEDTYVFNIGDSRTYAIKDNDLTQITKDDSEVWKYLYRNGKGKYTKDELRFITYNFSVTKCLGQGFAFRVSTDVIKNSAYDGLLLLSDGITDILSDKTMRKFLEETRHDELLETLLYESCYSDSEYFEDERKMKLHYKETVPGYDNATTAMYLKLTK